MGRRHAIGGAVVLPRIEFRVFRSVIVENLHLAHAIGRWPALAGKTNGEAVIAARGQLVFQAGDEIAEDLLGEDIAALLGFAGDSAVPNFILIERPLPAGKVLA